MRGKRTEGLATTYDVRITPAHAGKTKSASITSTIRPDHPRACGENHSPLPCEPELLGSPPRVRGKRPGNDGVPDRIGITPACAGKTRLPRQMRQSARDHPRVCGENNLLFRQSQCFEGSPPRVRGKLCRQNFHLFRVGITPACAGKTQQSRA